MLGLGFYPKKTKELAFVKTLGEKKLMLVERKGEGRCLANVIVACGGSFGVARVFHSYLLLGFFRIRGLS